MHIHALIVAKLAITILTRATDAVICSVAAALLLVVVALAEGHHPAIKSK